MDDWYGWRVGTLKTCDRREWQVLYDFINGLLLDIGTYPDNYGKSFPLCDIDWRIMLFLYKLFGEAECVSDSLSTPRDSYDAIMKTARAASYRKMNIENGLREFGFSFIEDLGSVRIGYPKEPTVIGLLHGFIRKCSLNKGYGFLAFLRCDLNELTKKTSIDFDYCISGLSEGVQDEIRKTDGYILDLKHLGLKRQITFDSLKGDFWNGGTIKYVSKAGFCYTIHLNRHRLENGGEMEHNTWWYIMPKHQGVSWSRINDLTVRALEGLSATEPDLSNRLFDRFKPCTACYGLGCIGRTPYSFNDRKRITCHGRMYFNAVTSDFDGVRKMITAIDGVLQEIS